MFDRVKLACIIARFTMGRSASGCKSVRVVDSGGKAYNIATCYLKAADAIIDAQLLAYCCACVHRACPGMCKGKEKCNLIAELYVKDHRSGE